MAPTVVLDWDGTVTERDTLDMVLSEFGDPLVYRRAEDALGRSLTLNEVIALEFSSVTAPLEEVVGWLCEHARVRAGFREFAAAHRPLVISSGFRELIEPILHRERVAVELLANEVDPRPDGWRVRFRDEAACATCGEPCKRSSLPVSNGGPVVFVGDGYSDRCAALAADRVFARDGLAEYLAGRRVPFEPFEDFRTLDSAVARQG